MEESRTYIKNLPISPKKLRFFLKEIKKHTPSEVLDYLYYVRQKPGKIFYQVIKSAINNAKATLKVPENLLKFKLLTVEEGIKLKRYRPGGRGTVKPILKRRSHIKIILVKKDEISQLNKLKETVNIKKKTVQKKAKTEIKNKNK